MAEPISKCSACGQEDDHPKHMIAVRFQNENTAGEMFHPDDEDRDGVLSYHYDCPSPWNNLRAALGVHEDPDTHAERMAMADRFEAIVALARSGVHGDELRARIAEGRLDS